MNLIYFQPRVAVCSRPSTLGERARRSLFMDVTQMSIPSAGAAELRRGDRLVGPLRWVGAWPIALLLAAAAWLKLGSIDSRQPLLTSMATTLLALAELALAVWLVSRWRHVGALRATAVVFGVFAVESLRRTWLGYTSCDCWGEMVVSPRVMLSLDLVVFAVVLLLLGQTEPGSAVRWRLASATIALLGIASLVPWVWQSTQQRPLELALVDLGRLAQGGSLVRDIEIANTTRQAIDIWSTSASCHCSQLKIAPCTLAPGSAGRAVVRVDLARHANRSGTMRVVLRAHDRQGQVVLQVPARFQIGPATEKRLASERAALSPH